MIVKPENKCEFDKYDEPRLHMECLLRTKLVEFDLSLRILLPLESTGIITLGDLIKSSPKKLRSISQLGKLSVMRLEELLKRLDLAFISK